MVLDEQEGHHPLVLGCCIYIFLAITDLYEENTAKYSRKVILDMSNDYSDDQLIEGFYSLRRDPADICSRQDIMRHAVTNAIFLQTRVLSSLFDAERSYDLTRDSPGATSFTKELALY